MEDQAKKTSNEERKDIDLGTILYAISKAFTKLGSAIYSLFVNLGESFLLVLIFLKKRIIWILLAAVVGFVYGSYLSYINGKKYYSALTARFNYGSNRALYNTVDYLNALVEEGEFNELSKLLSISEKEASSLVNFNVEAINDELIISDLYKQQFLNIDRNVRFRTDTFWTKVITYKDFKSNLTKYDLPLQKITAVSTQSNIFPRLQDGLIKSISGNGILKRNYDILQKTQNEEEQIIVASLHGLDTLRVVYNERLRQHIGSEPAVTSLAVLNQIPIKLTPELELYNKVLELKDELKTLRNQNVANQEIVQVLASFNSVGQKVSILKQNTAKYTLQAIAIGLLILVILEVYNAIDAFEKKRLKKVISE